MKSVQQFLVTFFISILFCASLKAQADNEGRFRMTKDEIINSKAPGQKAPGSSNLSAVQVVVLFGDPFQSGPVYDCYKSGSKHKNSRPSSSGSACCYGAFG